ncbi:Bacteriocin-protection, YdeI or OmpD-Associated [Mucilaginibacter gossypiicola]|uniref:Bacteriocin-protection, YdeI or OmpD-Associated n=1 Tax=Mucilaginibacter gossypiicola TaxID=551995 RepID=A0A1H8GWF6_9SPHI|nr:YdeI/OmpD-associated family protein [Mucilaginibacter gossypiicola]SEN48402.1 Bacteriocin-protection, YdeI or OmpD-Associated [Mucilaginibacter gossypiicola]
MLTLALSNTKVLTMNALAKKLMIKPNSRWLLLNAPAGYQDSLSPLPDNASLAFNTEGEFNGIQLFVTNSAALISELKVITPLLKADIVFWIIYPKKNSGIQTDLEMMSSWDAPAQYGLRPVASAAVNEVWTALRFRPVEAVKVSEGRNEAVRNNEHSAYIDVDNKIVTLPDYIKETLEQYPGVLDYFQSLAYSHKKEYVLWILTAKQEKTRQDRLAKMVEMLQNKKKNPSDK